MWEVIFSLSHPKSSHPKLHFVGSSGQSIAPCYALYSFHYFCASPQDTAPSENGQDYDAFSCSFLIAFPQRCHHAGCRSSSVLWPSHWSQLCLTQMVASASPCRGSAAAAFISSAPSKRSSETKIQAVVTSVDVTVEGVEHLIFLNIFLCFIYLNTKAALQTMSGLI